MDELPIVLGLGALVLLAAVFAVRISSRLGLPSLALYLGIGVGIGEAGLGVQFDDADIAQLLGVAALVLILAEGGLTTRWSEIRPVLAVGFSLSTVAVLLTIGITGTALHWLLGLDWRMALLWGAVLSSTDAAAVFSVLRGAKIQRRLAATLELESGSNDPPAYLAVVMIATATAMDWTLPFTIVYQLLAGAAIGLLLGWLGGHGLRRIAFPAAGLYPLATVAVCVAAYAVGQFASASGLLGAFAAGLVLGNSRLPHQANTLSFAEGLAWIAQIGVFVMLGLYASPARLLDSLVPGLVAGAVILLLSRPLSVFIAVAPFRMPWREQLFLSWAGLRGAVPIVLATIPLAHGVPGAESLLDAVFIIVVVFTLLQATLLTPLAKLLGVALKLAPRDLQVDVAPLEQLGAVLLQVRIPRRSRLHGVYLAELRVPKGASVSLVLREGSGFTPEPSTRLQEEDQLLVVTTDAARAATERRLRAVDRAGPIAGWKGERGD